jgi:hypothetical protein
VTALFEPSYTRRGALILPATLSPEAELAGYTDDVRQLEIAAAEAQRIRELPSEAVLQRQQEITEHERVTALDAQFHAITLDGEAAKERAELQAKADAAAAKRRLAADPSVRALELAGRRDRLIRVLWAVMISAMAYTCVNVQTYVAGPIDWHKPMWWVAWLVDPLLSAIVVSLVKSRGDLAGSDDKRGDTILLIVELGVLFAVLGMNVAPVLSGHPAGWRPGVPAAPLDVSALVRDMVIPSAAFAVALVLPIVAARYNRRIDALHAQATVARQPAAGPGRHVAGQPPAGGSGNRRANRSPNGSANRPAARKPTARPTGAPTAGPTGGQPPTADTQPADDTRTDLLLKDGDLDLFSKVRDAIAAGDLPVSPTNNAVFTAVGQPNGAGRGRSNRVAEAIRRSAEQ